MHVYVCALYDRIQNFWPDLLLVSNLLVVSHQTHFICRYDLLLSCGSFKFAWLWLTLFYLWSSNVFFCLYYSSLLYGLQVPALPAAACVDFCCLCPCMYKNLTTVPYIFIHSLSSKFRSQFKMGFVHSIFHFELALFWPACCPFHSAFPCLASTCSQYLPIVFTNAGVSLLFCIYCICISIFQLLGKHAISFLQLLVLQVLFI